MLQSPIGRVASQPMRNIETFPSKHMYLYLSLVEGKVAEFYHNMVKITYFHCFLQTIDGVLLAMFYTWYGMDYSLNLGRERAAQQLIVCWHNQGQRRS